MGRWDSKQDAYDAGFDDGFWVAIGAVFCILSVLLTVAGFVVVFPL